MNPFEQYNTYQILLGVLVGENDAFFKELHRRYADTLFGVCYKMLSNEKDAEEARNDVLLKIKQYLQNQRKNKEVWTENCIKELIHNPQAYFYKVANNFCIDILRTQQQTAKNGFTPDDLISTTDLSDKNDISDGDFLPSFRLIDKDNDSGLFKLLHQLEEMERDCMKLYYIEDYSYREIAEIFTITNAEVKTIMKRAQRKLKTIVAESGSKPNELLYS